jgi:hypothetical protein
VPLAGGRETSWRVAESVLKPLDMHPDLLVWQAALLSRLEQHRRAFRVSPPRRAPAGDLVVDGWTAWRYEPGRHRADAWREVLAVGRAFHAAVRDEPPPPGLAEREDQWAVADRVAWGETAAGAATGAPHLDALLAARGPITEPAQLVHADLAGNVLLAEGTSPAVIDLSLYWRPAAFAEAVALVDLAVSAGAPLGAVEAAATEGLRQQLVRALLFRIIAEHLGGVDPRVVGPRYDATVRRVLAAS